LLSVALHDCRSPLGVILGYTQMLSAGRVGPLTDRQREVTAALARSARDLNDLVDRLSALVNLERGTLPFNLQEVTLASVLMPLAAAGEADGEAPGRSMSIQGTAGSSRLTADPIRLRDALGLLAAEVAASDDAPLAIRHAVRRRRGHDVATVVVGTSTSVEILTDAPPSTVPERAARPHVGLTLAQCLIEAHHGRIRFAGGDAFIVELPVAGPDVGG
jgi:K+-sensing histidine kinase KdpD